MNTSWDFFKWYEAEASSSILDICVSRGCFLMEESMIDTLVEVFSISSAFLSIDLPATICQAWWVLTFLVGKGGESEIIAVDDMVVVNYSLL